LTLELCRWLVNSSSSWVKTLVQLLAFTLVLAPGWVRMLYYYLFDKGIVRNVAYGLGGRYRNLLDVYKPYGGLGGTNLAPTVVFVSGGAYIIGYKLWSALVARGLSRMGCLVIVPDYRNFPQADMEEMQEDIRAAVDWTVRNACSYGGNGDKIVLAGQSAGAHICLSALVEAHEERLTVDQQALGWARNAMTWNSALNASGSSTLHPGQASSANLTPRSSAPGTPATPSVTWRDVSEGGGDGADFYASASGSPSPWVQTLGSLRSLVTAALSPSPTSSLSTTATPTPTQKKTKTIRFSTPIKGQPTQGTPLDLDKIALVVLVSGPYDLFSMKTHLHARGLDSSILTWICRGNLAKYSPTRRIARHVASSGDRFCYSHFPRTALFHGSDDATVPLSICEDLAEALLSGGGRVEVNVYPGLSHTDPILEGPLRGDDTLMLDIVARVRDAVGVVMVEEDLEGRKGAGWVHPLLVTIAKRLNPF